MLFWYACKPPPDFVNPKFDVYKFVRAMVTNRGSHFNRAKPTQPNPFFTSELILICSEFLI